MFLIAVDKFIPSFLFESIVKHKLLIRFYSPPIQLRFKLLFLLCAIPREKNGESENPQCLMWLSNSRPLYSSVTVTQHITTVQRYCFLRRVRRTKCISWITVRKKIRKNVCRWVETNIWDSISLTCMSNWRFKWHYRLPRNISSSSKVQFHFHFHSAIEISKYI